MVKISILDSFLGNLKININHKRYNNGLHYSKSIGEENTSTCTTKMIINYYEYHMDLTHIL